MPNEHAARLSPLIDRRLNNRCGDLVEQLAEEPAVFHQSFLPVPTGGQYWLVRASHPRYIVI